MKKITAAILMLSLIICMCFAFAAPGTQQDPLLSKEYVDGTFKNTVTSQGEAAISSALNQVYSSAVEKLNDKMLDGSGYSYAAGYDVISLEAGQGIEVYSGGSIILSRGALKLTELKGTVIDISSGKAVSAGTGAAANVRYFSANNTTAVYGASSASRVMVNGFYKSAGKVEVPVDPDDEPRPFDENVFKDVKRGDWYYDAIGFVYSNRYFNGISSNEFGVNLSITRADFVTVLYRFAGSPEVSASSSFSDVKNSSIYYYNPVCWAAQNGIVLGYEDGRFDPAGKINREQMMAFIYRYVKAAGGDMQISSNEKFDSFTDTSGISDWAVQAIKWCTDKSIVNGSGGIVQPKGDAQRCQVAQITLNLSVYMN